MKKKLSEKDKKDWQKFIDNSDHVENKDQNILNEKGSIFEKTIDLHGYTLDEANNKIKKIIIEAFSKGIKKINIITGKGLRSKNLDNPYQSKNLAILKYSVPDFIKNNSELMSKINKINFDEINSASKGSFEIILKKNK